MSIKANRAGSEQITSLIISKLFNQNCFRNITPKMKFFILLSVVTLVSAQCKYPDIQGCDTIEKYIDAGKFPDNKADVKDFCDKLFVGGKCLRGKANECLKGDLKDLANGILDREKEALTDLCNNQVDQFIDDVKNCFNKDEVLKGLKDIHTRYVDIVEAAQGFDKSTYKASICCSQLYSRGSVYELNVKNCGKPTADRLDDLLKKAIGELFHKTCGDAKTYDECSGKLQPDIKSKFDEIIKASPAPTPKHKFAVPTLIEMAHELNK